jgi:hypothetical protein
MIYLKATRIDNNQPYLMNLSILFGDGKEPTLDQACEIMATVGVPVKDASLVIDDAHV